MAFKKRYGNGDASSIRRLQGKQKVYTYKRITEGVTHQSAKGKQKSALGKQKQPAKGKQKQSAKGKQKALHVYSIFGKQKSALGKQKSLQRQSAKAICIG
ncbi:hypothetical protein DPMN_019323 [Dreissena polymorpha]|uniref:Uncharacterized protein n=1 Tax=Dreissena polymorpha TaxID=45954 RepID=A0A9D4NI89_DREPO|nr:hypothetical protein DPMN_019323 [Dreissena polymorpha]